MERYKAYPEMPSDLVVVHRDKALYHQPSCKHMPFLVAYEGRAHPSEVLDRFPQQRVHVRMEAVHYYRSDAKRFD
jgi:hypothetical protein